jgi:hypothetical protein
MRKVLLAIVLSAIVLCGCGEESVPKEEYDKVVAERDQAQRDLKQLQRKYDYEVKVESYKTAADSDLRGVTMVFSMMKLAGVDTSESMSNFLSRYSEYTLDLVGDSGVVAIQGVVDSSAYVEGLKELEAKHDTWEAYMEQIKNAVSK